MKKMKRKRLHFPWVLNVQQRPPHGHLVWARDPAWLRPDGRPREGNNVRYDFQGRHSHWRWGRPTMWKRLHPSEVAVLRDSEAQRAREAR